MGFGEGTHNLITRTFVRAQEGPWEDYGLVEGGSEVGEDPGDGEGAAAYRAPLLCWVV